MMALSPSAVVFWTHYLAVFLIRILAAECDPLFLHALPAVSFAARSLRLRAVGHGGGQPPTDFRGRAGSRKLTRRDPHALRRCVGQLSCLVIIPLKLVRRALPAGIFSKVSSMYVTEL